jgi:hypothetical protein
MSMVAQTSFYLTERDQEILEALKQRHGLSRSAVMRLALERLYETDAQRNTRLAEIAEELRRMA